MEIKILSKEDVQDMISEALSTDMNNDLWCENNSLRMQIKDLQELALNLTSNVEQLKKIVGWSSGYGKSIHQCKIKFVIYNTP